ncbi:hypothetical protein WA026_005026 [Henosepilachna vigintioctopunctata]|uniref:Uncharacterized protein n=1 Tax=Henosepilachna vigintioctopunctata TaxID=420089 RepID=A0AAW1UUA4_9CUCU
MDRIAECCVIPLKGFDSITVNYPGPHEVDRSGSIILRNRTFDHMSSITFIEDKTISTASVVYVAKPSTGANKACQISTHGPTKDLPDIGHQLCQYRLGAVKYGKQNFIGLIPDTLRRKSHYNSTGCDTAVRKVTGNQLTTFPSIMVVQNRKQQPCNLILGNGLAAHQINSFEQRLQKLELR